ncbi:MAG TPA: heme exporter protein CcmD [Pseudomonadales bacterium]|nr:heme exporter protein CcmD [Pseudomonadales bacterium]
MYFANFAEAWHMAGHGPFVWVSYAVTLIVLIILVWWPLQKRRQLFDQQRRLLRINAGPQGQSSPATQED